MAPAAPPPPELSGGNRLSKTRKFLTGDRLAKSRERFLTAEPVEPDQVRDTILASWWRSRQWNVPADHIELSYVRDPDLDTPLTRNALPVLRSLRDNLDDHDGHPRDVPMVLLYTKHDLPAELLLTRTALNQELNPRAAPDFMCSALRGEGVLEALHGIITIVMRQFAPARGSGT